MEMAGHPILGSWVIIRNVANPTEAPVVADFTADGGFIDPGQGTAGAWEPSGPNSAAITIVPFIDGGAGGYGVVRGEWTIDESGDAMSGTASVTILTPDGRIVANLDLESSATRLHVDPVANGGNSLSGFPTWSPAPATPAA
jgi:hypothetical protein